MLTPDPQMLYPLVCRILVPGAGLVDFGQRLPVRGGLTLTALSPDEVQEVSDQGGVTFTRQIEGGDECPDPDTTNSHTITQTTTTKPDGTTETVTTEVKKTLNPDGTVTTETTETRPGAEPVTVTTLDAQVGRVGAVRLRLEMQSVAEFALIRPLTKLRKFDVVQLTENYTDRHQLRIWPNAIVEEPPEWPFLAHARGAEFHQLRLSLIVVGARP